MMFSFLSLGDLIVSGKHGAPVSESIGTADCVCYGMISPLYTMPEPLQITNSLHVIQAPPAGYNGWRMRNWKRTGPLIGV
jgi:hypothetical protein